jgi:DNA-binding transcriptional ArsR family regulator
MVVDLESATNQLFSALSDSTRRDIVRRVMREEASVSVLAERYTMSFAAVQKHIAVLERAGLVWKQRCGREQLVRGDILAIRRATTLLDQYEEIWRDRIGRIEHLLTEPSPGDSP